MSLDPHLTDRGFLLQGVLSPAGAASLIPAAALDYPQLLVLAHAGGRIWEHIYPPDPGRADPLDDFSVAEGHAWMDRLECSDYEVLYPGDARVDLRGLGRRLGWHHDSPLGTGVHPVYGTWFAYRLVLAARTNLPLTNPLAAASPCDGCEQKPCMTACPATAVGPVFNLQACATHRLQTLSGCASTCLARLACPAGEAFRYAESQIRYHYDYSLSTLKTYR